MPRPNRTIAAQERRHITDAHTARLHATLGSPLSDGAIVPDPHGNRAQRRAAAKRAR